MSRYQEGSLPARAVNDPTPMPAGIPKVEEVGATSAPLKSAAFFIGAYCREYNGTFHPSMSRLLELTHYFSMWMCDTEDFMLCKNENRDPGHCLKEGRRVTRCTQDLWVESWFPLLQELILLGITC